MALNPNHPCDYVISIDDEHIAEEAIAELSQHFMIALLGSGIPVLSRPDHVHGEVDHQGELTLNLRFGDRERIEDLFREIADGLGLYNARINQFV